jgi:hypothetical protein
LTNTDQLRARDAEAEMEQHHAVDEKQVAALSTSASILGPRPKRLGFPSLGPQVLRSSPPQPPPYLLRVDRTHHFLPFSFPVHSSPASFYNLRRRSGQQRPFTFCLCSFYYRGWCFPHWQAKGEPNGLHNVYPKGGHNVRPLLEWFAVAATFVVWLIRALHAGLAGGGFG